jgi:4-carboxymuconolactone decarboxylase
MSRPSTPYFGAKAWMPATSAGMTVEIAVSLRSINKATLGRNVMRRLPIHLSVVLALVLLGTATHFSIAPAIAQTAANPSSTGTTMPSDIDPKSGMRLPLPKREELDEAGQMAYDRSAQPGASIAGLQGPGGIQLFSPKTAASVSALNRYLRFEAGFTPHVREVAILITAREMDSQFEWVAHEPEALKEGVPQSTIDVIKYRRSTEGLDPTDALIIELGRQLWRDHKVKSETFAQLKTIFGPNKLVELVMLMGNYAATAALLTAVDMQLHAGKKPLLPIP